MSKRPQYLAVPNEKAANIKLAVFDFDGVFTDNTVYVNQKGEEMVRCFRGDGLGLRRLREVGVAAWVVSSEMSPVVAVRCRKLETPLIQRRFNKEKALVVLAKRLKIYLANAAYVGNDINDIECLRLVGVPIVVADAEDDAKKAARFQTKRAGGQGAVREVCDWIVKSKKLIK